MTTQTQTIAPTPGEPIDESAMIAAVRELATSMDIEAEPELGGSWPIDVGQRSISAEFSGSHGGCVYLSLAEADVERLIGDPEGAEVVLSDIVASFGIDPATVQISPIRPSDDLPAGHAVARDGERIVGLGMTMSAPGDEGAPTAASFEPSPLAATNNHAAAATFSAPISLLSDVDMQVTVELGRTKLPVRELLSLQPGMVIELDRQAGAPIDVLVNGRLIARGEVVVLDEQFGLRITEIITDAGAR